MGCRADSSSCSRVSTRYTTVVVRWHQRRVVVTSGLSEEEEKLLIFKYYESPEVAVPNTVDSYNSTTI